MTRRATRRAAAAACLAGAIVLAAPTHDDAVEVAAWFVRPATLPFAWRAFEESNREGDPAEAFARGQRIMQLLPQWTDGYAAFAYRYALAGSPPGTGAATRVQNAHERLDVAIAWLESARPDAGRREIDLLQALAFLPDIAVRQEPELGPRLRGGRGPAAIADHYMAIAEQKFPSAAAREQRTFFGPTLAGGLLAAGDVAGARRVLAAAIDRSRDVRDQQLATEWRARLVEVERWLAGDRDVDLTAVREDLRMAPLLPFLR
jgi:hypothetical protein